MRGRGEAMSKPKHVKHHKEKKPSIMPAIIGVAIIAAAIIITLLIVNKPQLTTTNGNVNNQATGSADRIMVGPVNAPITIIEYSDFECPYCGRALPAVNEVIETFGDNVKIIYKHFPLSFHPNAQKAAEASECARDQGQFKAYHDKLFENQQALTLTSLKSYAKQLGLDSATFDSCLDSGIKATIVKEDFDEGKSVGVTGTPGFTINGQLLVGAQPFQEFAVKICAFLPDHEACKNLPQSVETEFIILNDKDCADCNPQGVITTTQQLFPKAIVKLVDYSSEEGQALYEAYSLTVLPAFLFDERVAEDPNFGRVSGALQQVGDKYIIAPSAVGATYDPTAERCSNGVDDTGNGLVDCADPTCSEKMECREEKTQQLDLFVMSQCPYGTQALNAMEEVLDNFDDVNFAIHFIANDNGDGTFKSLHGQPEVDENIRELCVINHYPDNYEYMDYIWCRNQDIQSDDWEPCAELHNVDVDTIKTCWEGEEGKTLLREDIKLANSLGIGASPTWLANNQQIFSGIDADTVRQGFCEANPGTEGCENTLTKIASASAGVGCGV